MYTHSRTHCGVEHHLVSNTHTHTHNYTPLGSWQRQPNQQSMWKSMRKVKQKFFVKCLYIEMLVCFSLASIGNFWMWKSDCVSVSVCVWVCVCGCEHVLLKTIIWDVDSSYLFILFFTLLKAFRSIFIYLSVCLTQY